MAAAGKYRTLISIERLKPAIGPSGGSRDEWEPYLERRCKLRTAGVREQQQIDAQNTVLISHVIELRHDSQTVTITQGDRVRVLGGYPGTARILHIESIVEPDDQGVELQIRCSERSIPQ
jgi:head-tail adaptor